MPWKLWYLTLFYENKPNFVKNIGLKLLYYENNIVYNHTIGEGFQKSIYSKNTSHRGHD